MLNNRVLPEEFESRLRHADCISQCNEELIKTLCDTICRLTVDKEVTTLVRHIEYLAGDSMNEVNAAMEQVGAHYA